MSWGRANNDGVDEMELPKGRCRKEEEHTGEINTDKDQPGTNHARSSSSTKVGNDRVDVESDLLFK